MGVKMTKRHYGQNNPRDQLVTICGAIRGWILNVESGVSTPADAIKHIQGLVRGIEGLAPHIENVPWDEKKPKEYSP